MPQTIDIRQALRTKPIEASWEVHIHYASGPGDDWSRCFDNELEAKCYAESHARAMDLANVNKFPTGMLASVTLRKTTGVRYY